MDHSKRKSAEARRVNVIYFLSRNGRMEHPHLIRIHHFCHSGVHLRDVKRWLSELRGKEMPDSFTWSYQRRYKKGFVWQDLGDDELITPISNHEFVLLGSLHPSASSSAPAELTATAAAAANGESDFLPFSDQMDNSPEKEEPFVQDDITAAPQPPGYESVPMEKVEDLGKSPAIICGGRSNSWRASHLLCNFLPCRAAETADSAVLDSSRRIVARRGGGGGGGGADHGPRGQVTQTAMSRRPLLRSRSSFGNTNSSENDGKVSFLIL